MFGFGKKAKVEVITKHEKCFTMKELRKAYLRWEKCHKQAIALLEDANNPIAEKARYDFNQNLIGIMDFFEILDKINPVFEE